MRPLLIATSNAGKLREIRDILADVPYELRSLADLPPLVEPDETGATFEANAELKARYYSQATGLLTVADDSGLEVDALDKAPGVLSARFPGATYADKFATMFAMLDARGVESSTARFVCAIALVDGDRVVFEARGVVEGEITRRPRGEHGFGYDPIFYYPPFGLTLAEVPLQRKREVSHRGHAFEQLRTYLTGSHLSS